MQKTQHIIIEGLNAHADPIDTEVFQGRYICGCYIIGITLYGEFFKIVQTYGAAYAVDDLRYLIGC